MKVFGQTNFAVRLPSAISAGLTALLIGWIVHRQTRDALWAVLSATIYLTSILVLVVGVTSVLDGVLTLFLTAAITFFFLSDQETESLRKTVFLSLFGICCGLAFLTKGFVALAIPAMVIAPYCLWCRKWKELLLFPALPIALAAGMVLPWAVAILLGGGLAKYFSQKHFPAFQWAASLLAGVLALSAVVLTGTQFAPGFTDTVFAANETREWMILIAVLVIWSAMLVMSVRAPAPRHKIAWLPRRP